MRSAHSCLIWLPEPLQGVPASAADRLPWLSCDSQLQRAVPIWQRTWVLFVASVICRYCLGKVCRRTASKCATPHVCIFVRRQLLSVHTGVLRRPRMRAACTFLGSTGLEGALAALAGSLASCTPPSGRQWQQGWVWCAPQLRAEWVCLCFCTV